ncbi:MAG: hypothetical protein HY611_03170 [Elusimicrobia bacterium]|nr:hypothetical protein [Elusimicrobiota bacterium]
MSKQEVRMFGLGKKQVTLQELAEVLYDFAVEFTELMANRELVKEASPYKGGDRQHFMHEWLIMMFWVMHRIPCGCAKEPLMAAIFKTYFAVNGIMQSKVSAVAEQKLIMLRLTEYDKAFDPAAGGQQFFLGGLITKNLLNRETPVVNAMTSFETVTHVLLLMKEVKEICDKYKVIG